MKTDLTRLSRARGARMIVALAVLLGLLALNQGPRTGMAAGTPTSTPTVIATAETTATGVPSPTTGNLPVSAENLTTVEQELLNVVNAVQSADLPAATRTSLLGKLGGLTIRLNSAEGLNKQLNNKNEGLDLLLAAKLDASASLDKLTADLQINLDQLQANIDANVNANVDASVGGLTLSVKTSADTIKADLGAQASRLLVDINADLDVIKIITLHAHAHVDATRLAVTLHALISQLTLDLNAVMKDLKVLAKANLTAAISAEAKLRVQINAEVNGLSAKLTGGIDSRINLQLADIAATTALLNSTLSSVAGQLVTIEQQV